MPNHRTPNLRTVSNDASRLDVARHVANRETGLIAQALGKLDEPVGVGEVADEAERDANRPRALAAAARDEVEEPRGVHVRVELQRRAHGGLRDALRSLPRSRGAEAAGAQRDAFRARPLLPAAGVEKVPL